MGRMKTAALVASTLAATPAWASDKSDFETCDGRQHPGKQDDGMRAAASTTPFSRPLAPPAQIAACTRALASPRLLPTQSLRRAHLLRARAAAHLASGDPASAIADLDAAQESTRTLAQDRFFQRSMGVSLTLMRALARAAADDAAGARTLASQAMEARPYALDVQRVGASILQFAATPDARASYAGLARLDPDAATMLLIREAQAGHYAQVVKLRAAVTPDWPATRLTPVALAINAPEVGRLLGAMIVTLDTAYARAATGDPAGARRDLAEVRARVADLRPQVPVPAAPSKDQTASPPAATSAPPAAAQPDTSDPLTMFTESRARQIETRIAVAEGRTDEAIAALVAAPMPRNAATVELLTALKAALPAAKVALVPDITPFETAATETRKAALLRAVPDALIAPETPRVLVDYERARPNILGAMVGAALSMGTSLLGGVGRTAGFRSTDNPDGTVTVEFLGNTPSATLVQEMTLLRAAELTRAAGKPAFTVTKRQDFVQRLTQTQYGREISSTPAGYKTILTVRYQNAAAEPERSFDAVRVIDALGPLYYQENKTS